MATGAFAFHYLAIIILKSIEREEIEFPDLDSGLSFPES